MPKIALSIHRYAPEMNRAYVLHRRQLLAELKCPGLTTVAQPTDALGQAAANCLIERIQGLQSPPRKVELPGTIIVRGSTSAPNI